MKSSAVKILPLCGTVWGHFQLQVAVGEESSLGSEESVSKTFYLLEDKSNRIANGDATLICKWAKVAKLQQYF